jgi:hypothetical protein
MQFFFLRRLGQRSFSKFNICRPISFNISNKLPIRFYATRPPRGPIRPQINSQIKKNVINIKENKSKEEEEDDNDIGKCLCDIGKGAACIFFLPLGCAIAFFLFYGGIKFVGFLAGMLDS